MFMDKNKSIHNKVIRLFSGEASLSEKKEIKDWINLSNQNKKLYADLQEIWLASGSHKNSDTYDVDRAIYKFKGKVAIRSNKKNVLNLSDLLKYAAILILLISLPFIYFAGKKERAQTDDYTTIACAFGDKSTVTLPDGSLVYLNSGSKLRFNNNFQDDMRKVALEGEAYFSVVKNKKIPFRVNAGEIEIEVLGTEFNLKAYREEETIVTTLVEGSIQIKSTSQKAVMEPNQKMVFNRFEENMTLYNMKDISSEIDWKDGRMTFRNESLAELEQKLERWFDVDIEFADDNVKLKRFTGILERESILEALSYFNYSDQVAYKINENEITFYSK